MKVLLGAQKKCKITRQLKKITIYYEIFFLFKPPLPLPLRVNYSPSYLPLQCLWRKAHPLITEWRFRLPLSRSSSPVKIYNIFRLVPSPLLHDILLRNLESFLFFIYAQLIHISLIILQQTKSLSSVPQKMSEPIPRELMQWLLAWLRKNGFCSSHPCSKIV